MALPLILPQLSGLRINKPLFTEKRIILTLPNAGSYSASEIIYMEAGWHVVHYCRPVDAELMSAAASPGSTWFILLRPPGGRRVAFRVDRREEEIYDPL